MRHEHFEYSIECSLPHPVLPSREVPGTLLSLNWPKAAGGRAAGFQASGSSTAAQQASLRRANCHQLPRGQTPKSYQSIGEGSRVQSEGRQLPNPSSGGQPPTHGTHQRLRHFPIKYPCPPSHCDPGGRCIGRMEAPVLLGFFSGSLASCFSARPCGRSNIPLSWE